MVTLWIEHVTLWIGGHLKIKSVVSSGQLGEKILNIPTPDYV